MTDLHERIGELEHSVATIAAFNASLFIRVLWLTQLACKDDDQIRQLEGEFIAFLSSEKGRNMQEDLMEKMLNNVLPFDAGVIPSLDA